MKCLFLLFVLLNSVYAMEELAQAPHKTRAKKRSCFKGMSLFAKHRKDHDWVSIQIGPHIDEAPTLLAAVMNNKPEAALRHILAGANVNETDNKGWASLHYAARDRNPYIARLLLAVEGIDTTLMTDQKETAMDIILQRKMFASKEHQDRCDMFIAHLQDHAQGKHPYTIKYDALIRISRYSGMTIFYKEIGLGNEEHSKEDCGC
jgi:hypothetical protein